MIYSWTLRREIYWICETEFLINNNTETFLTNFIDKLFYKEGQKMSKWRPRIGFQSFCLQQLPLDLLCGWKRCTDRQQKSHCFSRFITFSQLEHAVLKSIWQSLDSQERKKTKKKSYWCSQRQTFGPRRQGEGTLIAARKGWGSCLTAASVYQEICVNAEGSDWRQCQGDTLDADVIE